MRLNSNNLLISQSLNDEEVPAYQTEKLAKELALLDQYKVLDTDHARSINRDSIKELAYQWIFNA